jgi:riboflavin-specific deaminase-like protein
MIVERVIGVLEGRGGRKGRPVVTLSWAQTLNAMISGARGTPFPLSSSESLALTHRLRSLHAAILVGIGTVLADDPLLSVRFAEGPQPRPIVLDSRLRTPAASRLMSREDMKPWIFHSEAPGDGGSELVRRGARLFRVEATGAGLDLAQMLAALDAEGIGSVMVEGGAGVLSSFLAGGFAAQAVITVAPFYMDGYPLFPAASGSPLPVELEQAEWESHGRDAVVWGRLTP